MLGSNLHVIWLCLTYIVKFKSIVLSTHIFSTLKLLLLNKNSDLHPPLSAMVSIQLTPPPPLVTDVICEQPLRGGDACAFAIMCWGGKNKRVSSEINWTTNYDLAEKLGKQIWMCVHEIF